MDPTTGTIDMDLIQTGISAGDRTARAQLTQELRSLIQRETLTHLLPQLLSCASYYFCRRAMCIISLYVCGHCQLLFGCSGVRCWQSV